MSTLHVSIHGIPLKFSTSSESIFLPVKKFLEHFSQPSGEESESLMLTFNEVSHRSSIPYQTSSSAQQLFSHKGRTLGDRLRKEWQCSLFRDGHRLIADFHEQGLVIIDDREGIAEGYIIQPQAMHPDIRVGMFHFGLVELLKHRGLYTIHATALEKYGRGILIPGFSGRGKTTTFLSLLRSGYRCLSDDHPLLRTRGDSVDLLPFPVKVDVTEPTIAFFPELRDAPESALGQGVRKQFFYVEDMYPGGTGQTCKPAVIIFPHVVDHPTSWLEPLSRRQALEELLPHGLLVYHEDIARREFQVLSQLIQQVDSYRLHFGRNVLELPELITPLMEEAAFGCAKVLAEI